MIKEFLIRTDTKQIVTYMPVGHQWSAKEKSPPFKVIQFDANQELMDDIAANGIPISDGLKVDNLMVDDIDSPTEIKRATVEDL